MNAIDLSRREDIPTIDAVFYRGAMPPLVAAQLALEAFEIVKEHVPEVVDTAKGSRRFFSSPIVPLSDMPTAESIAECFPDEFTTARVNLQGPNGKQGWHTDYILQPVVLYPAGTGFIDTLPAAQSILEARAIKDDDSILTAPVNAGDIGRLNRGGEMFHRGRNASSVDLRPSIVLH